MNTVDSIRARLIELQDLKYKSFQCGLMPTVPVDKVIGVRMPELRRLAREMNRPQLSDDFVKRLPHQFYEENNLHGMLIGYINDYKKCIEEINRFLPYVDNWATCDLISPKILKKYPDDLIFQIKNWISSNHTYTVRFGIKTLMTYYSEENFKKEYLELVSRISSDEYYVNMMVAWYFATELYFNYDATLIYLEEKRLNKWIHNKTIQKAIESYRITEDKKSYLKLLKI